jgi:hypothetical protein
MKKHISIHKFLFTAVFVSIAVIHNFAQQVEIGDPKLDNGIATLEYKSKDGWITTARVITFRDNPALAFPVIHYHYSAFGGFSGIEKLEDPGILIVTKTAVLFQSELEKYKDHSLEYMRTDIKVPKKDYFIETGNTPLYAIVVKGKKLQGFFMRGKRNGEWGAPYDDSQELHVINSALKNFDETYRNLQLQVAGLINIAPETSSALNNEGAKKELMDRFFNNKDSSPDIAYQASKAYQQLYPNEMNDNVTLMKKWSVAYEKIMGIKP